MGAMNKRMSIPALTKIMREFEKQNEKMEMTSEMMGDAIDDAFEVISLFCIYLIPKTCKKRRVVDQETNDCDSLEVALSFVSE